MASIRFTLNGKPQVAAVAPDMPLLWVLRDHLGVTGTFKTATPADAAT
jgi:isoquinoline 1-oxidoreductase alpha subunit